jgi:hypothetical protein
MPLADRKSVRVYSKTSSDTDGLTTERFDHMKEEFDNNTYINDEGVFNVVSPLLYQIQQLQEDVEELRRYISNEVGDGADGSRGPAGATGPAGSTGNTGAAGSNGSTGNTGAAGAAGARGSTGNTGAAGSTGAAGARGPAGAAGSTGAAGSNGNSHLSSWTLTNAGRGSLTVTDGSTTWTITGGR